VQGCRCNRCTALPSPSHRKWNHIAAPLPFQSLPRHPQLRSKRWFQLLARSTPFPTQTFPLPSSASPVLHVSRNSQHSGTLASDDVSSGGAGVHAVFDGVGKDTFEQSLASLRKRGVCVLYGAASGQVYPCSCSLPCSRFLRCLAHLICRQPAPIAPSRLTQGSLFLTRPSLCVARC